MLRHYEPLDKDYTRDSKKKNPILGFRSQYRFLSNFYIQDVMMSFTGFSVQFRSSEHAFMWHKSDDEDYKRQIMDATTAQEAKRLGNNDRLRAMGLLREDWIRDEVRIQVMYDVLKAKYRDIQMWLLLQGTNDRYLEETNVWQDTFWGRCNNVGHNHLGRLSMVIRHESRDLKDFYRNKRKAS